MQEIEIQRLLFEDRPKQIDWIGCLVLLVAQKT